MHERVGHVTWRPAAALVFLRLFHDPASFHHLRRFARLPLLVMLTLTQMMAEGGLARMLLVAAEARPATALDEAHRGPLFPLRARAGHLAIAAVPPRNALSPLTRRAHARSLSCQKVEGPSAWPVGLSPSLSRSGARALAPLSLPVHRAERSQKKSGRSRGRRRECRLVLAARATRFAPTTIR